MTARFNEDAFSADLRRYKSEARSCNHAAVWASRGRLGADHDLLVGFARRDAFTVEARTKAQWIAATGAHGIVCLRIAINRRATIGVASARRRYGEKGKQTATNQHRHGQSEANEDDARALHAIFSLLHRG